MEVKNAEEHNNNRFTGGGDTKKRVPPTINGVGESDCVHTQEMHVLYESCRIT